MKYIAVDSGKYATKLAAYDSGTKNLVKSFQFRTKYMKGTFEDDMFEKGTYIVQIDGGEVYKIGRDARTEPELESSKQTEIHKICTLSAAALACGPGEHLNVDIAIGIPLQICLIPEERIAYREFILGKPGVVHKVKIKLSPDKDPVECTFSFRRTLVYPEGIGVLYEYPSKLSGTVGIIDIGNLNTNHIYADSFQINTDQSFSDELGGKVLITGLAQTLTSEFSRVDENLAASTLRRPLEDRFLHSNRKDERAKEIEKRSRDVISQYLLDHVKLIRQKCDTHHWSLDFMQIVAMGGTSRLLSNELKEVFGDSIFIPETPEYINVRGFLRKLCADDNVDLNSH